MHSDRRKKSMKSNVGRRPLALYVHIPFCVRKCAYCDFLSAPASEKVKEDYVNQLRREIELEADCYPDYRGQTVFFGGGTPTTLRAEQLELILCKLKECFLICEKTQEPEITLECNPGTINGADLRKLREAGFNRLSIGLQSAQNEELERLGRIHTREDFLETFHLAREAGFRNINVDLMSALPGQSVESYANSLREVAALHPEHISAYSLIIEEGTLFYERYGEAERQRQREGEDREHLLPTEEEERRMYEVTEEILEQRGYHRYEISNYALPGYECRHNITYWRRGDYLGLGLGAASLLDNCRFTKSRDLREYERQLQECGESGGSKEVEEYKERYKSGKKVVPAAEGKEPFTAEYLHRDQQQLSLQEQMEEFMFLGLRLTKGISVKKFQGCFCTPIEKIYGDVLKKLERQGLLVREEDSIRLTKRGIDVSNVVLAEFLL